MTAHMQPDVLVDGRYRLVARIGSGGMADVWCATDEELGRRVALKVLHPRFAADPQFVERFRREASHAAGLQHPNVVAVFDRGEWDGTPYIAMEYIEGPTLKEIVRERGALPPALAADVVVQILRAARYAHKHGIVHRDLKPHNVILDEEGRVKVTDFGIARAGASQMTETGAIMGTAHYLSPEQAQGLPVDGRSDLYSVGVILYELLTGRVPFDAESPVSIAVRHVSETPVPPAELNPEVSPALDAVTMRALAKAPEDRFQDADAFIAALQAARDAPLEATAYAPVEVVEEVPPRRRGWLWLIALLALLAIALGAYLLLRPQQTSVPDVVGDRSDVAVQTLKNRGFEVDIQRLVNPDVPRDRVASQDPRPGDQADEGSTVRLVVSDGPGSGTVPAVTGMPQAKAERLLRSAGFKVSSTRAYSSDVKAGDVISSSPPEGTTADKGTMVRLTVSRGAQPVDVPSVVGRTAAEARGLLEGKGFKVSETDEQTTSKPDGTVLSQSPAGGASVKPGSTVKLTVAKAPPQVQVPDVGGDTKDEARQALRDNHLHVTVVHDTVDTPDQDGLVVKQEPQAGTNVDRGTNVTIHLGKFTPPSTPDTTPTPSPTASPTATATP